MHACMHARTHARTHADIHTYIHTYIHKYIFLENYNWVVVDSAHSDRQELPNEVASKAEEMEHSSANDV